VEREAICTLLPLGEGMGMRDGALFHRQIASGSPRTVRLKAL
jgi:hypothetical protein